MTDILKEIEADVASAIAEAESWFKANVEPVAKKAETAVVNVAQVWVKQFESGIGQAALAEAVTAVSALASGGLATVPAIAETVGTSLLAQGLSIAETDAQTVILNAARTALNAASIPAAAIPSNAPASVPPSA